MGARVVGDELRGAGHGEVAVARIGASAEVTNELELGLRVEERTAELRRAQTELLRREKLSTLGQLTATVAHELRNPLSAIRNTIFTVRETVVAKGLDARAAA